MGILKSLRNVWVWALLVCVGCYETQHSNRKAAYWSVIEPKTILWSNKESANIYTPDEYAIHSVTRRKKIHTCKKNNVLIHDARVGMIFFIHAKNNVLRNYSHPKITFIAFISHCISFAFRLKARLPNELALNCSK